MPEAHTVFELVMEDLAIPNHNKQKKLVMMEARNDGMINPVQHGVLTWTCSSSYPDVGSLTTAPSTSPKVSQK